MSKVVFAFAASGALISTSAYTEVPRTQPDRALQELARQLEPYKSVTYALSHGYRASPQCESRAGLGAMGYHYSHPGLMGLTPPSTWVNGRVNGTGTYTGANPPAVLLYMDDASAEGENDSSG
jgi:hypothetical protein